MQFIFITFSSVQTKDFRISRYPLLFALWFLFLSSRYALASSNFPARATFPATRAARGISRRVTPAAEVTTSPPAPMAAVAPAAPPMAGTAAGKKKGCAKTETRLNARVKAIKP